MISTKNADGIILIIVVALIAISFGLLEIYRVTQSGDNLVAVIKQRDKVIETIDLNKVTESRIIKIEGDYLNVIMVEKGRIAFIDANCPDRVCVDTGGISKPGENAVCLPNMVSIRIIGMRKEVDDIVY